MPSAYKCYDCGDLYEGEPFHFIATDLVEGQVELCKECTHKLKNYLKGDRSAQLDDYEEGDGS